MSSHHSNFRFSADLLQRYSLSALENAQELSQEADLLCQRRHFARAYFLAVASIEETGKAFSAFNAQRRKLSDPSVTSSLRKSLEDHSHKINAAFTAWILSSPDVGEVVMPAIDLMIALRNGREPSMYTDIRFDSSEVTSPASIVREVAARDCVHLAKSCLATTQKYTAEKNPFAYSRADDELFSMKHRHVMNLANTEDFWWYFIAQMDSGKSSFSEAVSQYQKQYIRKGLLFKARDNE